MGGRRQTIVATEFFGSMRAASPSKTPVSAKSAAKAAKRVARDHVLLKHNDGRWPSSRFGEEWNRKARVATQIKARRQAEEEGTASISPGALRHGTYKGGR